jgi:hypothetical protein
LSTCSLFHVGVWTSDSWCRNLWQRQEFWPSCRDFRQLLTNDFEFCAEIFRHAYSPLSRLTKDPYIYISQTSCNKLFSVISLEILYYPC